MREIRFRAWDEKKRKMNYTPQVYDGECLGEYSVVGLNEALANGGDAEGGGELLFEQFTGLKDKNGKEIWEGDIILEPLTGRKSIVTFDKGMFVGIIDGKLKEKNIAKYPYEVIGNIHQNGELLERKND